MNVNIFLPDTIKVGFQNRKDTFSGKLAYIIYYDNKGVLRKEKSWSDWKDNSIPSKEYENKPLSGFVLNKKAGGYQSGWNYRQSYIRVYDPRGFEIEITLKNLLFILDNYPCLPGKGLEGEFVYGWSGTELILLPINTQEYKEIQKFNEEIIKGKSVTNKELIEGATYKDKDNKEYVYMGFFPYMTSNKEYKGKKYFFYKNYGFCEYFSTINNKNLILVNKDKPKDFDTLIKKILKTPNDSEGYFDKNIYKYVPYTLENFYEEIQKIIDLKSKDKYFDYKQNYFYFYTKDYKYKSFYINTDWYNTIQGYVLGGIMYKNECTFEEIKEYFDKYKPCFLKINK